MMTCNDKKFIPVMLTPFMDNGAVDFKTLTRLTEFYINAGAKGLFANCLSSEMFELTPQERIDITKHVVDVAGSDLPVISTGSFEESPEDQIDFIKRIQDAGVRSIILSSCVIAGINDDDQVLEDRFGLIADEVKEVKFGIYECPVPYKRLVSPGLLSTLLKSGRINYFKDTSLDIDMVREKIAAGANHNFGLYDAYIVNAVESLKAGAAGLSCIQGNFFPELIVWLCHHYNHPDKIEEVAEVQQFLSSKMDLMHDVYPIVSKIFLKKRGFDITNVSRRRVGKITNKIVSDLGQLLIEYNEIKNKLEVNNVSQYKPGLFMDK